MVYRDSSATKAARLERLEGELCELRGLGAGRQRRVTSIAGFIAVASVVAALALGATAAAASANARRVRERNETLERQLAVLRDERRRLEQDLEKEARDRQALVDYTRQQNQRTDELMSCCWGWAEPGLHCQDLVQKWCRPAGI